MPGAVGRIPRLRATAEAVALQHGLAELFKCGVVFPRQRLKWIRAVLKDSEIQEVIGVVLPPNVAPQVGIRRAHHHFFLEFLEERLQFRREQFDGAPHDQLVSGKSPCKRRAGREEKQREGGRRNKRSSHVVILVPGVILI